MKDYQQYINEAIEFSQNGNDQKAIQILEKTIEQYPDSDGAYYNLALIHHSLGNIDEAIGCFEKAGILNSTDPSIFYNLGAIYYSKDDFDKSEQNFRKAINIEPDNLDAIYGLGKLYQKLANNGFNQKLKEYKTKLLTTIETLYNENIIQKAFQLSEKALKLFPQDTEFINNYAIICYKLDKIDEAKEKITQAIQISPENTDIKDNYQVIFNVNKSVEIKDKKRKIAIFCGPDDKFISHIINHQSSRHEIKRFSNGTIKDMQNLMKWSDISWFEWCDALILHASKLPKECKIICRLHSYEAFTDIIKQVNWQVVDDLIFVAPHIRDIVINQMPSIKNNTNIHVISNGVDLQKYKFKDKQKGFNLAYVGYINHKKNPSLLLQCMKHLVDIDDRYILHIAGQHQELRFKLYFDHIIKEMELDKNIVFHGWIDDVSTWLEDKHFTISTSVLESFCHGIADAMACGLKPIIHNFIGAKELYPQKYIFNTVSDFSKMVLSDEYNPIEYREYIESNYSQDNQLKEIDKILNTNSHKEVLLHEDCAY